MTALMQDLLAYGRPSTPTFTAAHVIEIVDAALRACDPLAQKSQVRLQKELGENVALVVDRDRITRALQNLIDNAVQHSPQGTAVTIQSALKTRGRTKLVSISVRDQGRGFAPEDLNRVFEPFFSRRRGGTGLGLALVQQIVTEHGGEVVASNAAGGGAAVTITIPVAER